MSLVTRCKSSKPLRDPPVPPLVVAHCHCLTSIREEAIPEKTVANHRHGAAYARERLTQAAAQLQNS